MAHCVYCDSVAHDRYMGYPICRKCLVPHPPWHPKSAFFFYFLLLMIGVPTLFVALAFAGTKGL